MKKLHFIFALVFLTNLSFGQSRLDSLVRLGIKHHDSGQYEQAIEFYRQALTLHPKSAE
jgi:tetratricopeptide (TPR) repeat protein